LSKLTPMMECRREESFFCEVKEEEMGRRKEEASLNTRSISTVPLAYNARSIASVFLAYNTRSHLHDGFLSINTRSVPLTHAFIDTPCGVRTLGIQFFSAYIFSHRA